MYCPNCGQDQVSDTVRFCTRCGLQMSAVAAVLANNGEMPAPLEHDRSLAQRIFSRFGAKLFLLSLVLLPIAILIALAEDVPEVLLVPILLGALGIFLFVFMQIFTLIFGEVGFNKSRTPKQVSNKPAAAPLPPARSEPIPASGNVRTDTAEMAQPPSVTESTTRLLEIDQSKS